MPIFPTSLIHEVKCGLMIAPPPLAFYCRARPQGCDAIEIFKQARCVFIGYPLVRRGANYNPQELTACLVNPTCPDDEWAEQIAGRRSRMYSRNRNFIPTVTLGSIVLIPRPSDGIAYLGRIKSNFKIFNCPDWGQGYLQVRSEQCCDIQDEINQHIADVAQGWEIDQYIPIDYSMLPGWLRGKLLGRSTFGELSPHPLHGEITAHSILNDILEGSPKAQLEWSLEPNIVKDRLVDSLNNPSVFENLVVALLQLEYPDEIWHHTGGPGDGGIDGLGCNKEGRTVGLMQAKYIADTVPSFGNLILENQSIRRYGAVLIPENPTDPEDGTIVLDLKWIVDAVCRHWPSLPLALTLRIGERRR